MKTEQRQDTLWRSMRVLSLVRILMVLAITAVFWLSESALLSTWQSRSIAASYLLLALLIAILNTARLGGYRGLLLGALLVDLIHITALIHWSGLLRSVFASLFFLPVVGAALLGSKLAAMATASMASISLLIISFMNYSQLGDDTMLLQTALLGTGFFTTTLVLNKISQRVLEQEALVREQRRRLESQLQINKTVVSELDRGLLAFSSEGEVLMLNLQAARLLAINSEAGRPVQSIVSATYPVLMQKMQQWQQAVEWESVPTHYDLTVLPDSLSQKKTMARQVRVRPLAITAPHSGMNELLLALEDLRELEGRATQLKLASMGRLSASIAHEIRNPLAAVSHAAALMAEETEPEPPRLLRIIQENVQRIDRIVENVLSVSRSGRVRVEPVALSEAVRKAILDMQRVHCSFAERVRVSIAAECFVWFDREHLAQILHNLLENAARYASLQKGAISLSAHLTPAPGLDKRYWDLLVEDDGCGLSMEVRPHLFEPFFTTHAQGTGLGLYLARELATANQASLFVREEKNDPDKVRGATFILRMKQAHLPNLYQRYKH